MSSESIEPGGVLKILSNLGFSVSYGGMRLCDPLALSVFELDTLQT